MYLIVVVTQGAEGVLQHIGSVGKEQQGKHALVHSGGLARPARKHAVLHLRMRLKNLTSKQEL